MSRILGVAAVATCLALMPTAAQADVKLSRVVAHPIAPGAKCKAGVPVDAPAGSHRDMCVSFDVSTPDNDDVKGLVMRLAPGIVGDPTAADKCTQAAFESGGCPAGAQVGTVEATVVPSLLGHSLPLSLPVSGKVYNVVPKPTEPARLGLEITALGGLLPPIRTQSAIRARLTDYGIDSVADDDFPRTVTLLGLDAHVAVTHMALTLWGSKAAHPSLKKAFETLPTSCTPATTTIEVIAWDGAGARASDTFTPTDCAKVPFNPTLEVGPKTMQASTPTGVTATLRVPATKGDELAQSSVRRIEISLPTGMTVSAGVANGLTACSDEQFGLKEDRAPRCPAASEVGDVRFVAPGFGALTGKVYFGVPTPSGTLRTFIAVEDPRLRVKQAGEATVDPTTGQIKSILADAPPVPFEELSLTFKGGPNAMLSTGPVCGTQATVAKLTPSSGGPVVTAPSSVEVVDCQTAFTPSITISSSNTIAGAPVSLTAHVERPDRQVGLLRSVISMPPGLIGALGSVPQCPVAQARAGACTDYSRIGSARVLVGNGPSPLALNASLFLTEGYDGAPAGLAIAAPAAVGPLDLGTVVTMSQLRVRPDGGVDFDTGNLAQSLAGIPTVYRVIETTIDRPNLMFNPSSRAPLVARGTFIGVGGEQATSDAPYQVSGCDRQPYAPKLAATIEGAVNKGGKPTITTSITQQFGEANSRRVEMTLPKDLSADTAVLGRACAAEQYAANSCPPAAVIGSVRAASSLLPGELTGTVTIVKAAGSVLPELAVDLRGPVPLRMRIKAALAPDGRVKNIIEGSPDVPINKLEMTFAGGENGLLIAARDLCAAPAPKFDTIFQSHGGAERRGTVAAQVACVTTAAAKPAKLKASVTLTGVKRKRPALRVKVTAPSRLRELRVTLPSKLRIGAGLARATTLATGGKRVRKPSLRRSGRTLVIKLPSAGTRSVDLRLKVGALAQAGGLKVGTKLSYTVTGTTTARAKLAVRVGSKARA